MKSEELAMLCIAYEGVIDINLGIIKFPKNIPDWVHHVLEDNILIFEKDDHYYCMISYVKDNNKESLQKIINIIIYEKDYLLKMRYLIPEISINYINIPVFLDFIHLFIENITDKQDRITQYLYHGGESCLYEIFGILTFITEWADEYSTDAECTIFKCDEKILPCNFTAYDIEFIGGNYIDIISIQNSSKIEYIKIAFTNVLKSIYAWYEDSKEFRDEYIDFLRDETYLKNTACDNEDMGILILDSVRAYLVKRGDFQSKHDEDRFLAKILTIFSKYKSFVKEPIYIKRSMNMDKIIKSYKFIPAQSNFSYISSSGCFSELRILINRSSCWYINIDGNIVTTDTEYIDNLQSYDDIIIILSCIEFMKKRLRFKKSIFSNINTILGVYLYMQKMNQKELYTISHIPKKSIKEIDLLMYYANYYVVNSSNYQYVNPDTKFVDDKTYRNLNALIGLFDDENEVITKSEGGDIEDRLWNIGMYGIYMFISKCKAENVNINRIRRLAIGNIRKIDNLPLETVEKISNPLMQIAEDPVNKNGIEFILAAASLNIDTYIDYPIYQYFVNHITDDMIIHGFDQLDIIKKKDFHTIYNMLNENLSCNTVPIGIYALAIATTRDMLSHRVKDIEKDTNMYLKCLRLLDNKYESYIGKNSLNTECYFDKMIDRNIGIKIMNYLLMNYLSKQVEGSIDYLKEDRISKNWDKIMLIREYMYSPIFEDEFNEMMITLFNMLE